MTLVEVLVASGLGTLVLAAILALTLFSARSFAALTNYVDLDNVSRTALDTMTMEIRQAERLISGDANQMTFLFANPTNAAVTWTVSYVYTPSSGQLVRLSQGTRRVILRECDFLRFSYYQRNPVAGTYDQYPAFVPANPAPCKLVQMSWICSRQIMQQAVNTESVQSARVVIRKQ